MSSIDAGLHGMDTPLSVAALQIVKEALKPEASPASLAHMAEQDPAFALRVIAFVNSAALGVTRKVSDVRQAAALLGVRGLRSLGMSLALSDMMPMGQGSEVLLANSLRRAIAAQLLAERLGATDRDSYFTVGLFLEVGLLARAREDLASAVQVARAPASDRLLFERSFGLVEHPLRGAELGQAFGLPEETIRAIRSHHDPEPPATMVGRVAWVSERIAGIWESGDINQARTTALDACSRVGLEESAFTTIVQRIPELVTAASSAFERDVGDQKSYESLLVDVNRGLLELTNSYEAVVRRLEVLLQEKEELTRRLAEANDQLERLAHTDALTGLANKRSLEQALIRDLARADRDKTYLSVVIADADHFKQVNDRFGHPVGDQVLKRIAEVISSNLRTGDLATRFGGEEFVLLLPGTNAFGAKLAAERVRRAMERTPMDGPRGPFTVTISFGVASARGPGCGGFAKLLIEQADQALYAAKAAGRNRVMMFGEVADLDNEPTLA
jgi:diguanylate cyclase (GGDEF)-like protein